VSARGAGAALAALLAAAGAAAAFLHTRAGEEGGPEWVLPQRHRLWLRVEAPGKARSATAGATEVDLARELAAHGAGPLDWNSIQVVGHDAAGRPYVFDASAPGGGRFALPWRAERLYPLTRAALSFLVPERTVTRYAVYFDPAPSPASDARRYAGLVGDGDCFSEGYGRRELAPSAFDDMADLDGDGDLDLVKGGTEPVLRVYESVGGGRYEDRGWLTSGGEKLVLPRDDRNRSWVSVELHDWDGDGDQDLFAAFMAGPFMNQVLRYENTTAKGGPLTFEDRGPLRTSAGAPVVGRVSFADWDGDGHVDALAAWDGLVALHRNPGSERAVARMVLEPGRYLEANGEALQLEHARVQAADLDGDGDLDLVAGEVEGRLYWFENVGTRTAPLLTVGRMLAYHGYMDSYLGVAVADFDGDGLLDVLSGRFWERSLSGAEPRVFGRLFRNAGTRTAPAFESRGAGGGAPYVEAVLPVDALRQNGVRAVDWDEDGRPDLLAGDSDGYVRFFRNLGPPKRPVFAPPANLQAGGAPIKVLGEEPEGRMAGYARVDVADWDGDGRHDLFVADGRGWLTLYRNAGARGRPSLAAGRRLGGPGGPIDGTSRGSVLVADWDGDGLDDVLFAMVGEGPSANYDWPRVHHADPERDRGVLFYRNVGARSAPRLGQARWIRAGPQAQPLDLERPNLGDVVDWNGDGRLDLIVCEFETSCRVFLNTAQPGRPRLRSSAEGLTLLRPWTAQTISGADAFDWDGDGREDVLSGQGHAGSSLRFFARGYLEDLLAGTLPRVTVETAEAR
jgi:hypothetical protein